MRPFGSITAGLIVASFLLGHRPARAATETVVYSFAGSQNGAAPASALFNIDGYVIGTTSAGGPNGGGTLFQVKTRSSKGTVVHSFGAGGDGANPAAGLSICQGGGLCGTTSAGGSFGAGAIFAVVETEKVLYSFKGGKDGETPLAALLIVDSGYDYGTTSAGGAQSKGTVFSYSAKGHKVLHSFGKGDDGAFPASGLSGLGNGVYFGTTKLGGSGNGTVYQIDDAGKEKVLYAFQGGADGANPTGGILLLAAPGGQDDLYDTTTAGGPSGDGTVYGLTMAGQERVVHAFSGADGSFPVGEVILFENDLWGVTRTGGAYNAGTVFKIDQKDQEQVVYSFTGGADGGYPLAGLLKVGRAVYGTTSSGGPNNDGVVFRINP